MVSVGGYGPRGPWFETWSGNPGSGGLTTDLDRLTRGWNYVVPSVFTPRDLVSKPDNMDETVLHS